VFVADSTDEIGVPMVSLNRPITTSIQPEYPPHRIQFSQRISSEFREMTPADLERT